MGGGCTCHSVVKKYFLGSSDFILNHENNITAIPKNNHNKIKEKNIKIIHKEDSENNIKSNMAQNSDKTKTLINKNNISNISNIKANNTLISNEDNKRKSHNINNSIFYNYTENSKKFNKNNNENDNSFINNKNDSQCNNNSKRKIIEKKLIETEKDRLKKSDTNYNYNMGEGNFIFINISRGSSMVKNESEKLEPTTPKIAIEKEGLDNLSKRNRKYSQFKSKPKNQSNFNNKIKDDNTNIILYMNNYSEEMLKFINSIRKRPETFVQYIDNIINNNIQKLNDDIYIISKNIEEKVKLMEDYLIVFEQIKRIMKEFIDSKKSENLEELKYNEELEIILDEADDNHNNIKNYNYNQIMKYKKNRNNIFLDLSDDKIANLILEKRKQLKNKYPESFFKLNVIRDIEINILIQISMELFYNPHYDEESMLKEIIFNPKYKNFAVSWANEINRNFISISCFA